MKKRRFSTRRCTLVLQAGENGVRKGKTIKLKSASADFYLKEREVDFSTDFP